VTVLNESPTGSPFSLPAGSLAFCDAAYNPAVDANVSGLGVLLQNPERKIKVLIQIVSSSVSSVLDAEAQVLLLAVRAVEKLGWTGVSFFSDNKVVVEAASAKWSSIWSSALADKANFLLMF
jgi:ribonuclease HI